MEIELLADAVDDLNYWRKSGNKAIQNKIKQLLADIKQTPFDGIGKPEALKYAFAGKWSRRINKEHRVVYEVKGDKILIYSLKGHYS
jgi:toxin YoeB